MSRALACLAALAVGCDTLKDLRAGLRDVDSDEAMGRSTLRVEVDPADGITILLDDARVGSVSPWTGTNLKAGLHTLQVRAMGYHSLSIPVQLVDDETVTVPVALRRRPVAEPLEAKGQRPRKGSGRDGAPPPPPPPPPEAPGPSVPPGVESIDLTVAATPKAPITLDGLAADGRALTLKRTSGTIGIGGMSFGYRLGGRGLLFITPPDDAWTLDGKPIRGAFKQNPGISRLQRPGADGSPINVLIRR